MNASSGRHRHAVTAAGRIAAIATANACGVDMSSLTVLSYGIGQDSWAILAKLALDPDFRNKYAPGDLLVIAADTGNEHPETYAHCEYTKEFCRQHGIEFVHLTKDMGFHTESWQTLQFYFKAKGNIASKAYPKTCTDNLKIKPIYKFLDHYVGEKYGFKAGRKAGIKSFAATHGNIRVLIGIAKGEERRLGATDPHAWQSSIDKVYPLIDIGYGRKECQDYLRRVDLPVPPPSNCVFCPFKNKIELLWTYRALPEMYQEWVEHEARKIANWEGRCASGKNLGVNGKKLLPEVLAESIQEFGHLSLDELDEYRMSHGHLCTTSY